MTILVFDIGKTNLKISVAAQDGRVIETLSAPNRVVERRGYHVMDLDHAEAFLFAGLEALSRRHVLTDIITATHGCLAMLVLADGRVELLPDYESTTPDRIDDVYRQVMDVYPVRGSAVKGQAHHTARQLVWWQIERPEIMAEARFLLLGPQYFAWRLSGVAAGEVSMLGALTHLWDVPAGCPAPIVSRQGWSHLIPPIRPAWETLGPLLPEFSERFEMANRLRVRCGVHDSTANFYRYQAAGMRDVTLLSTGTWLVGLSNARVPADAGESDGISLNADIFGAPLGCALAMAGREFAVLSGLDVGPASEADIVDTIARKCFALPSFADSDGFFPGSANGGRIAGPEPQNGLQRRALALLYVALLADRCLDLLGSRASVVIDGSFARDPLFASLVATLRPQQEILLSTDIGGTAAGAAAVAGRSSGALHYVAADLNRAAAFDLPMLSQYRAAWRASCRNVSHPPSNRSVHSHVAS